MYVVMVYNHDVGQFVPADAGRATYPDYSSAVNEMAKLFDKNPGEWYRVMYNTPRRQRRRRA